MASMATGRRAVKKQLLKHLGTNNRRGGRGGWHQTAAATVTVVGLVLLVPLRLRAARTEGMA